MGRGVKHDKGKLALVKNDTLIEKTTNYFGFFNHILINNSKAVSRRANISSFSKSETNQKQSVTICILSQAKTFSNVSLRPEFYQRPVLKESKEAPLTNPRRTNQSIAHEKIID